MSSETCSRPCTHKIGMSARPPTATALRTSIDVGEVPRTDLRRARIERLFRAKSRRWYVCARGELAAYPSDLSVYLRKPLVDAEQCAEWALRHRLAIGAEIFLVHCRFVRLARFCFHCDLRPQ